MPKRLTTQASQRSSAFAELIEAHREPHGAGESTAQNTTAAVPVLKGKSANPDYIKLTSYIRGTTHKSVKRRLLDEQKDFSELVEELLSKWLASSKLG